MDVGRDTSVGYFFNGQHVVHGQAAHTRLPVSLS
jgi:hypothetical protein